FQSFVRVPTYFIEKLSFQFALKALKILRDHPLEIFNKMQ
ncbi:hypothetical protein LEP1GSC104_1029, partial [Leptospira interrogans str. UI 12621]